MKKTLVTALCAAMALCAAAQNQAILTLSSGEEVRYNTAEVDRITFSEDGSVAVSHANAASYEAGVVTGIHFLKQSAAGVRITEAAGWLETAYAKWAPMAGATDYAVYVKAYGDAEYTRIDSELVRNYGSYGRADVPGLKAGEYTLRVVPVIDGAEASELAAETAPLSVKAHDRSGFAHFGYSTGVGAYNNDGTLKQGARVIYVNANTAKTVKATVITSNKGNTTEYTGFQNILDGYMKGYDSTPIAFRIVGKIGAADMDKFSSSAEGLQIKNNRSGAMNITIEGIGDDATFHGFGILMRGCESVELRNLGLLWYMDDGVSCDTDNLHCWIHHLDIFYGQKGSDSDQAKGDGSLDVKGDSKYMTFSYNHFWDSGKSSLCGMTSESGPNYLTYHHNWFDHSDSRHPRIRTMSVHVYNNYFDGVAKYGIGSTKGSDVFVEANYFRDCKYPMLTSKQGSDVATDSKGTFSGEDGGSIKAYANEIHGKYYFRPYSETNTVEFDAWVAAERGDKMPASVTAKQGGATYSNWDTDPSLMYDYTADAAVDVPAIVKGAYGAGRCGHGDFTWTFNNNIQDENYDVIAALSNALRDYESWLVGNYTGETVIGAGGVGSANPGGDATCGDEFPFGDYNRAESSTGGSGDQPSEVDPADYFITSADGGYFRFDDSASAQVAAWQADGTLAGGKHVPGFTNADYFPGGTGSYQLDKSGGQVVIRCPSISVFKAELVRTGSYSGKVEVSSDGVNYTEVASLSGSKGKKEVDWSAALKSDVQTWVRITNSSSGGLNIVGLMIVK